MFSLLDGVVIWVNVPTPGVADAVATRALVTTTTDALNAMTDLGRRWSTIMRPPLFRARS
jgi:hypothetical protein